jgi:hypothetical protein
MAKPTMEFQLPQTGIAPRIGLCPKLTNQSEFQDVCKKQRRKKIIFGCYLLKGEASHSQGAAGSFLQPRKAK